MLLLEPIIFIQDIQSIFLLRSMRFSIDLCRYLGEERGTITSIILVAIASYNHRNVNKQSSILSSSIIAAIARLIEVAKKMSGK